MPGEASTYIVRQMQDGFDLVAKHLPDELFGEGHQLVTQLISKGFCVVQLDINTDQVRADVAELKAQGRFYEPPEVIAEGLLGAEGSSQIAELDLPDPVVPCIEGNGLDAVDSIISHVGLLLRDSYDDLDLDWTHRCASCIHEAGTQSVVTELSFNDVKKWLPTFARHKIMVIVFVGPEDGSLKLDVYSDSEAESYEVSTSSGTVVILRPDIMSHSYFSPGSSLAVSCFFTKNTNYSKHSEGNAIIPVAKELETWTMEELKRRKEEEVEWDSEVPRDWQRDINQMYFQGQNIAIESCASTFPNSRNTEEWFRVSTAGVDYAHHIPLSRWDHSELFEGNTESWKRGKIHINHGAFCEGTELFDNKLFSLSLAEARGMDPNQRLLLEIGYAALNAGGKKKKTLMNQPGGVFVGHTFGEWALVPKLSTDGGLGPTGAAGCIAANRLSYVWGMKGPSFAIDTEASASMTALYLASESLATKGKSSFSTFAVAAGCQLMLTPRWWPQMCSMGLLSIHGRSLTFDISASGYMRSEGCGATLLQPMTEWVDGQRVIDSAAERALGIIAGASSNTNGRSAGLNAPKGIGEQEVIYEALRNGGVCELDVDAVEAHGDGAFLADAVEVDTLRRSFCTSGRTDLLSVTSAKTSCGNMIEVAGMVSFLKVVLGAKWGLMIPNLHLREANYHINSPEVPLMLLTEMMEYPRKLSNNCAVSRGFGGTNGSIITWGKLDQSCVPVIPSVPEGPNIYFWPGGGGDLDPAQIPTDSYYITGSWAQWQHPQCMEVEGDGKWGFTVTLGANCWEEFQIVLDGDAHRILHPGRPQAPKDCPVFGPDEMSAEYFRWRIDGRCNLIGWTSVSGLEEQVLAVEHHDMGKPGDQYRVELHVMGKWRRVHWHKLESSKQDSGGAIEKLGPGAIGDYYIVASWNDWTFEAMTQDPAEPSLFHLDVELRFDGGEFQLVRNRDWNQVIWPSSALSRSGSNTLIQGPNEGGHGLNWFLDGRAGESFRIEFKRAQQEEEDVISLAWMKTGCATSTPRPSYMIVGTWDNFRLAREMKWTGESYQFFLQLGDRRQESFQILKNGLWEQALYPDCADANPQQQHRIQGPSSGGRGLNWTLDGSDGEPGDRYCVDFIVSPDGAAQRIQWNKLDKGAPLLAALQEDHLIIGK